MKIIDLKREHLEAAALLALSNYEEERVHTPILPKFDLIPELTYFADNGLGVVALEDDRLVGFLAHYEPRDHAFNSAAKGTYSPIHAHGAVKEQRGMIYKRMYQAVATKLLKQEITYHSIVLYRNDTEAIKAMFSYGFGLRTIDAIRSMEPTTLATPTVNYKELEQGAGPLVRELRILLHEHLGQSPCFMYSSKEIFDKWLYEVEQNDSRLFATTDNDRIIAYMEIAKTGENFVTETSGMLNICGAFCLPEYRGRNIYQGLLNYVINTLKGEGYTLLGVDYEGFNPTATGFWEKYFVPYTYGVVRRIDECGLYLP